jgi:hypothetical protein
VPVLILGSNATQYQSLYFPGTSEHLGSRVRIPQNTTSIPANAGSGAMAIRIRFRCDTGNNKTGASTGANYTAIEGNPLLDRDRYEQTRGHTITLSNGRVTFGMNGTSTSSNQYTWVASTDCRDSEWHEALVQRDATSGDVSIYVDGTREINDTTNGPTGSIQYPNGATPNSLCPFPSANSPCTYSDPYIVLGAEKHDANLVTYPPFIGWIAEVVIYDAIQETGASYTVSGSRATGGVARYTFQTTNPSETTLACAINSDSNGTLATTDAPTWSTESPF